MSNTQQTPHNLRIFTIISQVEQLLETAPKPKLGSGGRRLVDVDEIFDLLGDLKVTIPEDIRRANSVLIEADTLLGHANQDAVEIVEQAQQEADSLRAQAREELEQTRKAAEQEFEARVSEDSVQLEVQRRCVLLQQQAEDNAHQVFSGAKEYADAILQDVQRYLTEYHNLVGKNRDELGVTTTARHPQPPAPEEYARPAQRSAAQYATPQAPVAQAEAEFYEEEAPPSKKRGWFRKVEDEFLPESDEDEYEQPARRARRQAADDLDIDLEE